eukprot:SAG11_NODE_16_length_26235_cov_39.900417_19_plen_160_part_00
MQSGFGRRAMHRMGCMAGREVGEKRRSTGNNSLRATFTLVSVACCRARHLPPPRLAPPPYLTDPMHRGWSHHSQGPHHRQFRSRPHSLPRRCHRTRHRLRLLRPANALGQSASGSAYLRHGCCRVRKSPARGSSWCSLDPTGRRAGWVQCINSRGQSGC